MLSSVKLNPDNYHAPKPTKNWFDIIVPRVILPPILLWDFSKWSMNKLLGERIGDLVLPAQNNGFGELYKQFLQMKLHSFNQSKELHAKHFSVLTHDDATLDTFEIDHQVNLALPINKQKYVINLVGNGMCYEQLLDEMKADAENLHCNVVGFNFRGVGQSHKKPKSKDDLVTDGIAQVTRLIEKGVDPSNITLKGHSLGAGVATLVAKHFHDQGQKINLFSGRSFSSITNVLVGQVRTADVPEKHTGHHERNGNKLIGWLIKPFIKFGVSLVNWEMEAADAYRDLPDSYKEYMVVRSSKTDRQQYGDNVKDDPVIPHYASLHTALKDERREKKNELDHALSEVNHMGSYALLNEDLKEAQKALISARAHLNERKMVAIESSANAHGLPMDELTNRYNGQTSNQFFYHFFERASKHHEKARLVIEEKRAKLKI